MSDYTDISDIDYSVLLNNQNTRSFTRSLALSMSRSMESIQRKAKEVISNIERDSKPVSQKEVQDIVDDSEKDKWANAKQKSLF